MLRTVRKYNRHCRFVASEGRCLSVRLIKLCFPAKKLVRLGPAFNSELFSLRTTVKYQPNQVIGRHVINFTLAG